MEFWADVLSNLIGAGAGAFLGYWLGVRQERQKRKEEEKQLKNETINSLLQELDYNSSILGDEAVLNIEYSKVNVNTLSISSYESAVASGRFSSILPLNQINLSIYYEECKRIMNKVKIIESTFGISNQDIEIYRNEIIEIGNPLCDLISDIINDLKSEL